MEEGRKGAKEEEQNLKKDERKGELEEGRQGKREIEGRQRKKGKERWKKGDRGKGR